MSGFDLLSLIPANFEKVINKLQEKSYFRLQQTSKALNEAVQSSKNICVHVAEHQIYFGKDENHGAGDGYRDVECFYGVRFAVFHPRGDFFVEDPERFKKNCDYLKKCRITCEKLNLTWSSASIEHKSTLLDIVKPRKVKTESDIDPNSRIGAEHCEMLLRSQSKTLEAVYVWLDIGSTAVIIPKLLYAFSVVHIACTVEYTHKELDLLRIILKILRSQPFPNLRNFSLESQPYNWTSEDMIEYDTLKKDFPDLEWIWDRDYDQTVGRDEDGRTVLRRDEDSWSETFKTVLEIPQRPSARITVETVMSFATTTLSVELGDIENF